MDYNKMIETHEKALETLNERIATLIEKNETGQLLNIQKFIREEINIIDNLSGLNKNDNKKEDKNFDRKDNILYMENINNDETILISFAYHKLRNKIYLYHFEIKDVNKALKNIQNNITYSYFIINQKNNGVCFSNFCDKYNIPNIKILTTTEDNIEIYKNFIELTNNFEDNKDTYIFNNRLYISRIDTEINGTGKCIQSLLEFDKENLEIKNNFCIYKKDCRTENFNLMNAIAIINYTIGRNFHNPFDDYKQEDKIVKISSHNKKEKLNMMFDDILKTIKYEHPYDDRYTLEEKIKKFKDTLN